MGEQDRLKEIRSRRRRFAIILLTGAAVAALSVVVWPFVSLLIEWSANPFDDTPFNRAKWIKPIREGKGENSRGPMAEDVRKRFLRRGMTKKEVRRLLGRSDNSQHDEALGKEDHYSLGHWGFLSIDGDQLIIHYDKSGRMVSSEIYTH